MTDYRDEKRLRDALVRLEQPPLVPIGTVVRMNHMFDYEVSIYSVDNPSIVEQITFPSGQEVDWQRFVRKFNTKVLMARRYRDEALAATNSYQPERIVSEPMTQAMQEAVETFQEKPLTVDSAWSQQVGGAHYKSKGIQPMHYSMANGLDALQHTAIKYITRFREKDGIEDLKKARHVLDMLIEWEEKGGAI
jgi:hypothetical protein